MVWELNLHKSSFGSSKPLIKSLWEWPALLLQSVLQTSALWYGEMDLVGRGLWWGFTSQEGRQCLLCFTFCFTSEFLEQLHMSNSHFGGKNKAHEKRQWTGMLAGHLPPKSRMLLSQKSTVYSLTKKIPSWDITVYFFSLGFWCFSVWSGFTAVLASSWQGQSNSSIQKPWGHPSK